MTELLPTERVERSADPVDRPRLGSGDAAMPELAARKPKGKRVIIALAVIAALGAAGYYGWQYWTEGRFFVTTDDAYVKADMSTIAAKISGYVSRVAVVENQAVKQGDVLAEIDPVDYQLAVDAAKNKIDTQTATIARLGAQTLVQKSMIGQVRATLDASQADKIRAASEFNRTADLVERKFATPQRLEQARADRDRTVAGVTNMEAQVATAEANLSVMTAQKVEAEKTRDELVTALHRAQRDLVFATIRAPFDGVVGNKAAQPGLFVLPGSRLLVLVPLSTAYVEANFKETQIGKMKPGQRATIQIDAYSGRAIDGVVQSFAPASGAQFSLLPPENATGNFTKIVQRLPVRIAVPADIAASGVLRPGLSVIVSVDTRDPDKASPHASSQPAGAAR